MDSAVSGSGKVSAWARFVAALLVTCGYLAGEAGAQGLVPTYEKKASWAETIVALRDQAARQPQLFRPQPAFGLARPGRSQQAPSHPLVALWAQLERDFPLECDWMLQDLAACGYPCSNPVRADYAQDEGQGQAISRGNRLPRGVGLTCLLAGFKQIDQGAVQR